MKQQVVCSNKQQLIMLQATVTDKAASADSI